ncbi:MAG: DUF72 domain-containing protein [Elusimicrobiota bacterium]
MTASERVKVGCCGFPVARSSYFPRLAAVEVVSTATRLPRLETARRWRTEAPEGFEFVLRAWRRITHPPTSSAYRRPAPDARARSGLRCGHFRATDEVGEAWHAFEDVAAVLRPHLIVFDTPSSFYPNADHFRDMYRFFKGIRRGGAALVWAPQGRGWERPMVRKVCADLGLIHGVEPLIGSGCGREGASDPSAASGARRGRGPRYIRARGRRVGRHLDRGLSFGEEELRELAARCDEGPAYVFFENNAMWRDAQRFRKMVSQGAGMGR